MYTTSTPTSNYLSWCSVVDATKYWLGTYELLNGYFVLIWQKCLYSGTPLNGHP